MPLFPNQIPPSKKKLIIYTLVIVAIFLLFGLLTPKRDMPLNTPSSSSMAS